MPTFRGNVEASLKFLEPRAGVQVPGLLPPVVSLPCQTVEFFKQLTSAHLSSPVESRPLLHSRN